MIKLDKLKQNLFFASLVLLLIFIASCNRPRCDKPYILVGNDCCLDKNNNKICDRDEGNALTNTQGYAIKEKEDCPFDCCVSNDYKIKECQQDYECKSNKCIAVDTDRDGLTDIEEKQLGTNIHLADTDNDGLNDYQEVKIYKTNPLNPNTDGDRYLDGEEIKLGKNPLVKNSANIITYKSNEKKEYNIVNILVVAGGITAAYGTITASSGITAPLVITLLNRLVLTEKEVYKSTADLYFENVGDDYTKSINYNVNFYVDGKLVHTIPDSTVRLDEKSKSFSKTYSTSLTALQTAEQILNIINQKAIVEIKVENVEYEKY